MVVWKQSKPIVLASGSPRRKAYMEAVGLPFVVAPANIDETPHPFENPNHYVVRMAEEKAKAVAAQFPEQVVLAADTTVVCAENKILGQPKDKAEAAWMLKKLSGTKHRVLCGICVVDAQGGFHTRMMETFITFERLDDTFINAYLADEGHWRGVAGAYKIQSEPIQAVVRRIEGSFSGTVGLAMPEALELLAKAQ